MSCIFNHHLSAEAGDLPGECGNAAHPALVFRFAKFTDDFYRNNSRED